MFSVVLVKYPHQLIIIPTADIFESFDEYELSIGDLNAESIIRQLRIFFQTLTQMVPPLQSHVLQNYRHRHFIQSSDLLPMFPAYLIMSYYIFLWCHFPEGGILLF